MLEESLRLILDLHKVLKPILTAYLSAAAAFFADS
jgi:hypothetical protein